VPEAAHCRPWSGRSRAGAAGPPSRATSSAGEGLRAPAAAALDASEPNDPVGGAPPHGSLFTGLDGRQPALGTLKAFKSLTEAPAGSFARCPPNLNSHNHNQHAGRPCFSLAVQIERSKSTLRYDISLLRNCASQVSRMPFMRTRIAHRCMHRSTAAEPSCARCKQRARPTMRDVTGPTRARHAGGRIQHDLSGTPIGLR
jgi:hypothetical protein